jgi:hypothetical protein
MLQGIHTHSPEFAGAAIDNFNFHRHSAPPDPHDRARTLRMPVLNGTNGKISENSRVEVLKH